MVFLVYSYSSLFYRKKKDISFIYLFLVYLSILDIYESSKSKEFVFGFPEAPNRLDRFCQRNERGARSECFSDPEVLAKRRRCCSPSLFFSRFANLPL